MRASCVFTDFVNLQKVDYRKAGKSLQSKISFDGLIDPRYVGSKDFIISACRILDLKQISVHDGTSEDFGIIFFLFIAGRG